VIFEGEFIYDKLQRYWTVSVNHGFCFVTFFIGILIFCFPLFFWFSN
jgi:hypothetical protein